MKQCVDLSPNDQNGVLSLMGEYSTNNVDFDNEPVCCHLMQPQYKLESIFFYDPSECVILMLILFMIFLHRIYVDEFALFLDRISNTKSSVAEINICETRRWLIGSYRS